MPSRPVPDRPGGALLHAGRCGRCSAPGGAVGPAPPPGRLHRRPVPSGRRAAARRPEPPGSAWMSTGEKFVQMFIAIALFFAVVAIVLLLTQRLRSRSGELLQSAAFVLPAVALIAVGL